MQKRRQTEATSYGKLEIVELDEKLEEKQSDPNIILAIQHFIKYITWEHENSDKFCTIKMKMKRYCDKCDYFAYLSPTS